MSLPAIAAGIIVVAEECRLITRLERAEGPRKRGRPQGGAMFMNSLRFIFLCIISTGCSPSAQPIKNHNPRPGDESPIRLSGYCRSDGIMRSDLGYIKFVQFVNNDMAIYRTQRDGEDALHCAYPTDNEYLKALIKSNGIPYSHYVSVIP